MPQTNETAPKVKYSGIRLTEADAPLLDKLSPEHRQILLLLTANKSMEEISAAIGGAFGTAKSRLHRARVALVELRTKAAQ
jgi:DNA-directed RNA polymerase specialized sigma24 family protein